MKIRNGKITEDTVKEQDDQLDMIVNFLIAPQMYGNHIRFIVAP